MPTSTAGKLTRNSGFTLLELAVVIVLFGLFAALTVPRLAGFGGDDRRTMARRLAGTVKYLFNEAVLTGREHRLVFDLQEGSYRAQRLDASGELTAVAGAGRERRLPRGVSITDVEVAGKGKFSSGEVTTELYPAGWIAETVVHLERDGKEPLTLRIMPLTGTTEVYDGYREFARTGE